MKKCLALAGIVGVITIQTIVVRTAEQTWTGKISDSLCGASHDGMRKKGDKVTDRECTIACVNYQTLGAPRFVFVTGGKVYPIKKDRKSTRLNSSHVEISYAVFCLKKKILYRFNLVKSYSNY